MMIQILKEHSNRTEYKVLKKYVNVKEVELDKLEVGVLVIPGIVLFKLDLQYVKKINEWLENSSSQLILVPTWTEMDLQKMFNSSIGIKIVKDKELFYEEFKCEYKIEGKFQDIIYESNRGILGVNYKKDTSSGVITILTIPLLDYKLTNLHDKFKENLLNCIMVNEIGNTQEKIMEKDFTLSNEHEYIVMLKAAGYSINNDLSKDISKYFDKNLDFVAIDMLNKDLHREGFIDNDGITEKGLKLVENRGLKAFIRVLKEGRIKDGW